METAGLWREIHNLVIPSHVLSVDEVRDRLTRNRLSLAYDGETTVGNGTVRPPAGEEMAATVIVRVLPPFRRRGFGTEYLAALLAGARALGARRIETVVLAANGDGLAFATRHGFAEIDRYVVHEQDAEYVDLRLAEGTG